jgi:hypothetical protein
MKFYFQIALIILAFAVSWFTKKQLKRANEKGIYDLGLYFKLNQLSGEKAKQMAHRTLFIANLMPWVLIILLLLYNYLYRQ